MAAIVEDLRINVFGNGQYLYSTELISPRGSKLDTKLLEISKVTHQNTKKNQIWYQQHNSEADRNRKRQFQNIIWRCFLVPHIRSARTIRRSCMTITQRLGRSLRAFLRFYIERHDVIDFFDEYSIALLSGFLYLQWYQIADHFLLLATTLIIWKTIEIDSFNRKNCSWILQDWLTLLGKGRTDRQMGRQMDDFFPVFHEREQYAVKPRLSVFQGTINIFAFKRGYLIGGIF